MFEVTCYDNNGNSINHFTQWDLGQVIYFRDLNLDTAPIVHFYNKMLQHNESVAVLSTLGQNGIISVNVPNFLLQKAYPIDIYIYVEEINNNTIIGTTAYTTSILVNAREKPSTYQYVENVSSVSLGSIISDMNTVQSDISLIKNDITNLNNTIESTTDGLDSINDTLSTHMEESEVIMDNIRKNIKSLSPNPFYREKIYGVGWFSCPIEFVIGGDDNAGGNNGRTDRALSNFIDISSGAMGVLCPEYNTYSFGISYYDRNFNFLSTAYSNFAIYKSYALDNSASRYYARITVKCRNNQSVSTQILNEINNSFKIVYFDQSQYTPITVKTRLTPQNLGGLDSGDVIASVNNQNVTRKHTDIIYLLQGTTISTPTNTVFAVYKIENDGTVTYPKSYNTSTYIVPSDGKYILASLLPVDIMPLMSSVTNVLVDTKRHGYTVYNDYSLDVGDIDLDTSCSPQGYATWGDMDFVYCTDNYLRVFEGQSLYTSIYMDDVGHGNNMFFGESSDGSLPKLYIVDNQTTDHSVYVVELDLNNHGYSIVDTIQLKNTGQYNSFVIDSETQRGYSTYYTGSYLDSTNSQCYVVVYDMTQPDGDSYTVIDEFQIPFIVSLQGIAFLNGQLIINGNTWQNNKMELTIVDVATHQSRVISATKSISGEYEDICWIPTEDGQSYILKIVYWHKTNSEHIVGFKNVVFY